MKISLHHPEDFKQKKKDTNGWMWIYTSRHFQSTAEDWYEIYTFFQFKSHAEPCFRVANYKCSVLTAKGTVTV